MNTHTGSWSMAGKCECGPRHWATLELYRDREVTGQVLIAPYQLKNLSAMSTRFLLYILWLLYAMVHISSCFPRARGQITYLVYFYQTKSKHTKSWKQYNRSVNKKNKKTEEQLSYFLLFILIWTFLKLLLTMTTICQPHSLVHS